MAKRSESEKTVSQKEMVRLSIEELGADAKPQALQEQIKAKFNKELPTTIISNYKSVLKREQGEGASASTGSTRGRKPSGGSVQINDLEAVRALVNRLGAAHVRKLVDIFA